MILNQFVMVTEKYSTAENKNLKGEGPDKYQDTWRAVFLLREKVVRKQKGGAALTPKLCQLPKAEICVCAAIYYFKFISTA